MLLLRVAFDSARALRGAGTALGGVAGAATAASPDAPDIARAFGGTQALGAVNQFGLLPGQLGQAASAVGQLGDLAGLGLGAYSAVAPGDTPILGRTLGAAQTLGAANRLGLLPAGASPYAGGLGGAAGLAGGAYSLLNDDAHPIARAIGGLQGLRGAQDIYNAYQAAQGVSQAASGAGTATSGAASGLGSGLGGAATGLAGAGAGAAGSYGGNLAAGELSDAIWGNNPEARLGTQVGAGVGGAGGAAGGAAIGTAVAPGVGTVLGAAIGGLLGAFGGGGMGSLGGLLGESLPQSEGGKFRYELNDVINSKVKPLGNLDVSGRYELSPEEWKGYSEDARRYASTLGAILAGLTSKRGDRDYQIQAQNVLLNNLGEDVVGKGKEALEALGLKPIDAFQLVSGNYSGTAMELADLARDINRLFGRDPEMDLAL